MVKGIDVSHWQDDNSTPQKMNFAKAVKRGAKFVFIKVSERGAIDPDFEYNWVSAKEAGLLRGGYHYLRWDLTGLVQARIFSEILKDDPGELPPTADFEAPNQGSMYPSNALLEQFLVEVETKLDRKPMIYTSPGYWNIHGRNRITKLIEQKWAYYYLWEAHYVSNFQMDVSQPYAMQPWTSMGKSWTFWQYSCTGDGLAYGAESSTIDLDLFNGNLQALCDLAYETEPPPDDPDPQKPPNIRKLKKNVNKTIDNWAKNNT